MTLIHLVRHGEAEAPWGAAPDPGLSALGRAQAAGAAAGFDPARPLALISSPMRRCRETAAAFEALWGARAGIEPAVTEIQTPADIADRAAWLRTAFPWREGVATRWADLPDEVAKWRSAALQAVTSMRSETVVVTHFIAINALVGASLGRAETIVCRPAPGSVTTIACEAPTLGLVALGAQIEDGAVL